MRKLLYVIIAILVLMILADRALKVYEKIMADKEIKIEQKGNPVLTAQEMRTYAQARQFRLVPYTVFGLKPNFASQTVNINSLGLRGGEIEKKQKNSYRVAILGGSAVLEGRFRVTMKPSLRCSKKIFEMDLKKIQR